MAHRIVNTAALDAAGITRATLDPKGGKFDHDSAGELTGIVREDPAMEMVIQKIRRRRLPNASGHSPWHWPMRPFTASPARRISPSGTTSW